MATDPRQLGFTITKTFTWSRASDPRRALLRLRLMTLAVVVAGLALAALGFAYAFTQPIRSFTGSLAFAAAIVLLVIGVFAGAIFRLSFSSRSGRVE